MLTLLLGVQKHLNLGGDTHRTMLRQSNRVKMHPMLSTTDRALWKST